MNENCVKFSSVGVGARGNLLYEFALELHSDIDPLVEPTLFSIVIVTAALTVIYLYS